LKARGPSLALNSAIHDSIICAERILKKIDGLASYPNLI
jgi:hypothetical protein